MLYMWNGSRCIMSSPVEHIKLTTIQKQILCLLDAIYTFEYSLTLLTNQDEHVNALTQLSHEEVCSKFVSTFESYKDISFGKAELEYLAEQGYLQLHPTNSQALTSVLLPSNVLQYTSFPTELARKVIKFWYEHYLQIAEFTDEGRKIAQLLKTAKDFAYNEK